MIWATADNSQTLENFRSASSTGGWGCWAGCTWGYQFWSSHHQVYFSGLLLPSGLATSMLGFSALASPENILDNELLKSKLAYCIGWPLAMHILMDLDFAWHSYNCWYRCITWPQAGQAKHCTVPALQQLSPFSSKAQMQQRHQKIESWEYYG